jgi:hypothetical protein
VTVAVDQNVYLEISLDAANELEFKGIPLEAENRQTRRELNRVLERYETDFSRKWKRR